MWPILGAKPKPLLTALIWCPSVGMDCALHEAPAGWPSIFCPGRCSWAGWWLLRCSRLRFERAASWFQGCRESAWFPWLNHCPSGPLCCHWLRPSVRSPSKRSVLHQHGCCYYPSGLCCPWPPAFSPHLGPCLTCCHQGPALQVVRHAHSGEAHTLVLIVGTSMAWHVVVSSGKTFRHPGTCIRGIIFTALQLIPKHHCPVIVHVSTDGIKNQQSDLWWCKRPSSHALLELWHTVQFYDCISLFSTI